jgi:hypothetical protein
MIKPEQFETLSYEKKHALLAHALGDVSEDDGVLFSAKQLFEVAEKPSEQLLLICYRFLTGLYSLAQDSQLQNFANQQQRVLDSIKEMEAGEEEMDIDALLEHS